MLSFIKSVKTLLRHLAKNRRSKLKEQIVMEIMFLSNVSKKISKKPNKTIKLTTSVCLPASLCIFQSKVSYIIAQLRWRLLVNYTVIYLQSKK